jgi:hypothetical protein
LGLAFRLRKVLWFRRLDYYNCGTKEEGGEEEEYGKQGIIAARC